MALYIDRDIGIDFSGELQLDPKGDIKLANSLETYKSVSNFILRTDFGDYAPAPQVGSNLGSYMGKRNVREVHERMEYSIIKSLAGNIFNDTDVSVDVVPIDPYEALCIINLAGEFVIDGIITHVENDRIAYSFPFIPEGQLTPLTI